MQPRLFPCTAAERRAREILVTREAATRAVVGDRLGGRGSRVGTSAARPSSLDRARSRGDVWHVRTVAQAVAARATHRSRGRDGARRAFRAGVLGVALA